MTARPILFSGPMIRALLAGEKTQTRRVMSPQPVFAQVHSWRGKTLHDGEARWWCWGRHVFGQVDCNGEDFQAAFRPLCPYGVPGDSLWVRETWRAEELEDGSDGVRYAADDAFLTIQPTPEAAAAWAAADDNGRHGESWRPSIFMPRWASRLLLQVADIRVQRVQAITEQDAWAEGVGDYGFPRDRDQVLWDQLNGKRPGCSWADDPWVWAVTFRRVRDVP